PAWEYALTQADVQSAEGLLHGLPNRVHQVIGPHLSERPQHPAFVEDGRVWSYQAFADAVDVVAAQLVDLRIRPGDRVLIASENCVALAAFVFACSRLDAWAIVTNPRLVPRELDQIYDHSGARRIFITTLVSKEAADHAARLCTTSHQFGPF